MNTIEFIENYCCIKDKNTGEINKINLSNIQKDYINNLLNIKTKIRKDYEIYKTRRSRIQRKIHRI